MSYNIEVKTTHHEGYTVVCGYLGGKHVLQISNRLAGKWACEETTPLSSNFDYAHGQLECQRQTFDEVKRLIDRSFKRGDRVQANQTAGFNKGAKGVVEFAEPNGGKVWVRRDGSSGPVFYAPTELDFL